MLLGIQARFREGMQVLNGSLLKKKLKLLQLFQQQQSMCRMCVKVFRCNQHNQTNQTIFFDFLLLSYVFEFKNELTSSTAAFCMHP